MNLIGSHPSSFVYTTTTSTMSDITDSQNNNKLVSLKRFQTARGMFISRTDTRGYRFD